MASCFGDKCYRGGEVVKVLAQFDVGVVENA